MPAAKKREPKVLVHDASKLEGRLKAIGGSMSDDWNNIIANQAIKALWIRSNAGDEEIEQQRHATVDALIGMAPRDELEGMIVAQLGQRIAEVFHLGDVFVDGIDAVVRVIGPAVDGDRVMAEVFGPDWFDDLPEWLQSRPIQKILRLTADSDAASAFALEPRIFRGMGYGEDTETYFRPAFPDPVGEHTTLLLQNTIAAYLLRNCVRSGDATIFGTLKEDALAKAAAAKEFIVGETSKFQVLFDKLYGK